MQRGEELGAKDKARLTGTGAGKEMQAGGNDGNREGARDSLQAIGAEGQKEERAQAVVGTRSEIEMKGGSLEETEQKDLETLVNICLQNQQN